MLEYTWLILEKQPTTSRPAGVGLTGDLRVQLSGPVGWPGFPVVPVAVTVATGHQGQKPDQRLIGEDSRKVAGWAVDP